jgi:hypothetical protein
MNLLEPLQTYLHPLTVLLEHLHQIAHHLKALVKQLLQRDFLQA